MTLENFAIMVGEEIEVIFPDVNGNYMYSLKSAEITDGVTLTSIVGRSKNILEARNDYVAKITGKKIAFHAMDRSKRKEFFITEEIV